MTLPDSASMHRDEGSAPREPETAPRLDMSATRPEVIRQGWLQKRQQKVRDEIDRNRRGDYKVPTWVMAVLLVALITGWLLLVFLNG
ncbi:hypothetical protein SAMN05421812_115216 [Asanoa hainanensis]|uniref:Uncharacterized protein n=1 Tax=Asanoa hainanensis TaxID=560556 RepID=A0A239P9P4_9ACTN|nr:hypothetical protein [Asanoa hainanensis]SNT63767.1 hypothetical protein SAMN05421812_115216 [Asanoa hainanensis]